MRILTAAILFLSFGAWAQESAATKQWANEAEASVVQVGGNTTSESYSAKQKTSYKVDSNVVAIMGRYLQTRSGGTETAKQWEASIRYERELTQDWSAFVQHGAESDYYAGYIQRDNTDVGGKYYFSKTDENTFFTEAGLRSTSTIFAPVAPVTPPATPKKEEAASYLAGRLYVEYGTKINESVSAKAWVEYLPNFKDSDAYLLNYEPSFSVMMNQIFSIKLAYLVKYHNRTVAANEKKEDTTFTTALVAKF